MEHKRLTLFAGHYGSGKTNIAVNYAMLLAEEGKKVCIADLDIVNPYFRTKDSESELLQKGITLICSKYANSNVDLPAIPAESYRLVQDKSCFGVIDIGGDDRGAYALGRFADAIKAEGDYRMAFVLNKYRPLTSTVEDAVEIMRALKDDRPPSSCGFSARTRQDSANMRNCTNLVLKPKNRPAPIRITMRIG